MLQGEHSAILSTFIKLSFVIKIFVLSTFEWPLKTGFTVYPNLCYNEVACRGTELYVILYFNPYERYSPHLYQMEESISNIRGARYFSFLLHF